MHRENREKLFLGKLSCLQVLFKFFQEVHHRFSRRNFLRLADKLPLRHVVQLLNFLCRMKVVEEKDLLNTFRVAFTQAMAILDKSIKQRLELLLIQLYDDLFSHF